MKKCPYCSNPIDDSVKRCIFCGRNLDFELAKELARQKTERERLIKSVKIVLLTIIFMVVAAGMTIWGAIYSPIGSRAKIAATQTADALNFCNPEEVSVAAHRLIEFNDRWADIMALAVNVDHDQVFPQVDRLQKIRRDVKDVEIPECLRNAKASLTSGMDEHINGLLAYIRDEPLENVNNYITQGNFEMNSFADEIERLQKCAPGCE